MADEIKEEKKIEAPDETKPETEKKPDNGRQLLQSLVDPIVVTIQMHLILDKAMLRKCEGSPDVIAYILDTIFKSSEQFEALAKDLRREALGQPRLIIPSRDFKKLIH